jgi:hypothetical protein
MNPNPLIGELPNPFINCRVVGDNVNSDDYHRLEPGMERGNPAFPMTNSNLREILCNAHRWRLGYEPEDTKSTEWGSMLDCLVLTPSQFDDRFAVCPETYPDTKTGEPKPWTFAANVCKAWRDEHKGKQIVKSDDYQLAQNAAKFVFGDQQIAALVNCSRKQVMVVGEYQDAATGLTVPVKALLDLVPDKEHEEFGKVLADFKTTTNACEGAWTRKVWERRSDMQAAFFTDIYRAATGEDRTDWWHVVQETPPPWECVIWPLSSAFVEVGRGAYQAALAKYCSCLKSNEWPGYRTTFHCIEPRPWMLEV